MKTFLNSRLQPVMRKFVSGESIFSRFAEISASPYWARRRWLRLLGWPGVAGTGLLVVCMAFYLLVIRQEQSRLDAARDSVIQLQKQGIRNANEAGRNQAPAEQLAEFYRMFPDDRKLLPWLEKIFTLAQGQNITLDRGEYKVARDKVGKLMRFQMNLSLKGEYPQIRKYLDSLLTEVPIASLEYFQLGRQKIGDPALEARIRLALYVEQQP